MRHFVVGHTSGGPLTTAASCEARTEATKRSSRADDCLSALEWEQSELPLRHIDRSSRVGMERRNGV